ncbi:segregation and condensation protein A [Dethiobacter alkaliphilus]|uniref:Segregation and condensation protein A n=1 Tax=Dethiobacter alkaliphilus AHT 1 TaxID=555088 RepID=C0GDZ0_DETAL|nr:segregation/condensation protein A [Dethiobacter alkaliphilus]EEG78284.1 chromosome segregation and condensation protein ScpA [Dethiobacter alkaliphilus AHT 1]
MEYHVKLPAFEGPFALLIHLIEKAEVDVYEVSIKDITAEYLSCLQTMQDLNLEIASEFLVMAATLLKLKSKRLLPGTVVAEDELEESMLAIDSQEELVQRLLEYRHFRSVADELRQFEQSQKRVFVRSLSGEKVVLVNPEEEASLTGVTLPGLMQAFQKLVAESQRQPQEVTPDEFTVQDKIKQVLQALRGKKDGVDFFALFPQSAALAEIIVTFFALLELVRMRKVTVWQSGPLGSLMVMRRT